MTTLRKELKASEMRICSVVQKLVDVLGSKHAATKTLASEIKELEDEVELWKSRSAMESGVTISWTLDDAVYLLMGLMGTIWLCFWLVVWRAGPPVKP